MKIVLIGAGNVATHLGQALAKAGHQITQVYSRTEASAKELAEKLSEVSGAGTFHPISDGATEEAKVAESPIAAEGDSAAEKSSTAEEFVKTVKAVKGENSNKTNCLTSAHCSWTTQIEAISSAADLYLVMLKDSVLEDILPRLVQRNPNALYVHTAGSVAMSIWQGLTSRYGVLYPMQTFSKARAVDFQHVHFFIEANSPADTALLRSVASTLSSHVYEATSEQRKYLHLSAVFACNFTNHMYAICEELLTTHGLPFSSMFPLIDETAQKIHHLPPKQAQTGPAQRNDTNVMERQQALLSDHPELETLYRLISEHIVKYEKEK